MPLLTILEASTCLEYLNLSHTAMPSDKFLPSLQVLTSSSRGDGSALKHLDLSYTQLPQPVELMKHVISQRESNL